MNLTKSLWDNKHKKFWRLKMAYSNPALKSHQEMTKKEEKKISPEFKEELEKVRSEVKSGKYVVYKTLKDMHEDISE